jgi:hypothetical protein
MKRLLICLALMGGCLLSVTAQIKTAREAFSQMPDSILPYLTTNNRLDMLDFKDSNMRAVVQNKLGGNSELLTLADDSLTLQLSDALYLTMRVIPVAEETDGANQIIGLFCKIGIPGGLIEEKQLFYSVLWRKLDDVTLLLVKKS